MSVVTFGMNSVSRSVSGVVVVVWETTRKTGMSYMLARSGLAELWTT